MRNWLWGDPERYSDFVWKAATDSRTFARFRRSKIYRDVLEHVSPARGKAYFEHIVDPVFRDICLASEGADLLGGPDTIPIEGRKLSPTTCRYAKVGDEIARLFPDIVHYGSIAEIGIGYGGQARVLSEFLKRRSGTLKRYLLLDLWEVNLLARRYLEHFFFSHGFDYRTLSELDTSESFDLVISNYAFSELGREIQEAYLEKVILRARSGYITMNSGRQENPDFKGVTEEELLRRLPNARCLDEVPKSSKNRNYVVVFGSYAAA